MYRSFAAVLVAAFVVLLCPACGQEVDASIPIIVMLSEEVAPGGTITHDVVGELEIDGSAVLPERYEWSVVLLGSDEPVSITGSGRSASWVVPEEGRYLVSCRISAGNKSVTLFKELSASHTAASLQKLLAGHWAGTLSTPWQPDEQVTFSFQPDGTYLASERAFYYGSRPADPEAYPARLVLQEVISGSPATARGFVEFYFCYEEQQTANCRLYQMEVKDFLFSNDGQSCSFVLMYGEYGPMRYQLQRRE